MKILSSSLCFPKAISRGISLLVLRSRLQFPRIFYLYWHANGHQKANVNFWRTAEVSSACHLDMMISGIKVIAIPTRTLRSVSSLFRTMSSFTCPPSVPLRLAQEEREQKNCRRLQRRLRPSLRLAKKSEEGGACFLAPSAFWFSKIL